MSSITFSLQDWQKICKTFNLTTNKVFDYLNNLNKIRPILLKMDKGEPHTTKVSECGNRVGIPEILKDIVEYLKSYQLQISDAVEGEGRGGSLKDEGSIKKALWDAPKFKGRIFDEKARKCGDMTVLDYNGEIHVVNIKTSLGGTDNCFSKCGIVYALTDLTADQLPSKMNFMEMDELIKNHKADIPQKDYWFLCVNKKNSSEIMVRGAKQVKNWVVNINPSNILQINWRKEKLCEPIDRTWDEAYETIIGGTKKSLNKFWANVPSEWKY